jgi:hypothetical protein
MMKWFLLLTIFFSFHISAAECPDIDYRDRFTSERDQDGNGLCWAFAGSALIEEQLCLENPDYCGEQVSVIDGHRCYWDESHGLGTKTTGAMGTKLFIDCVLNGGVCAEGDAPFLKTDAFDSQHKSNRKVVKALQKTLLAKIKHNVYHDGCELRGGDLTKFAEDFGEIVEDLMENMAQEYEGLDINYEKALLTAKHYTDALRGVFISDTCQKSRYFLKDKKLKTGMLYVEKVPNENKLNVLRKILQNGSSASLGLCGQRARLGRYEDLFFMDKWGTSKEEFEADVRKTRCGEHAVVVNGMRMKDGRCQIHIRNSWGVGSGLGGWEDAETIMSHTITTEFIYK